ncbi:serine hydrolase [Buchananella hordeovulneris]|uniref:serine hydrolase n=1 Tax=Buchananella hordeovulneris TaxID=52770 RepID=UPI0013013BD5|nr:serine hydrolase [Buchananella hordeovulneris]
MGSFDYSNLGYAVLTRLLEVVTKRDWWTLATESVFGPLGIRDVSIDLAPERLPVIRTWTGGIRKQWNDTGPFIGAGGVHGMFNTLEQYATASVRQTVGKRPLGWMDDPTLWWHNGLNKDHGALIGVSHDGSRIVTVHTLGYNAGHEDKLAARPERRHPRG